MSTSRLPTYLLSHGAGPWTYMAGTFREQFSTLEMALMETGGELAHAETLLVVSAHRETSGFALSSPSLAADRVFRICRCATRERLSLPHSSIIGCKTPSRRTTAGIAFCDGGMPLTRDSCTRARNTSYRSWSPLAPHGRTMASAFTESN